MKLIRTAPPRNRLVVNDDASCATLLSRLEQVREAAVDVEWDGNPDRLVSLPQSVQLAWTGQEVFIHEPFIRALKPWVDSKPTGIFYSAKGDMWWFANAGIPWKGSIYDTMVEDALCDENTKVKGEYETSLKDRHATIFKHPERPGYKKLFGKQSVAEIIASGREAELVEYGCADARDTWEFHHNRKAVLEKLPWGDDDTMWEYFVQNSAPFTRVLFNMERRGFRIDVGLLDELDDKATRILEDLERQFYAACGEVVDFDDTKGKFSRKIMNSPQQLKRLFYDVLKYPAQYHMDIDRSTGEKHRKLTTDVNALEELEAGGYPIAAVLAQFRKMGKLKGTYIDGIRSRLSAFNRLHTDFMQAYTLTGRLASRDPNLQNVPRVESDLLGIRELFIASPGMILGGGDYCLAPGTRVLTADLRWVPICDVRRGDRLVAIDEHRPGPRQERKMRTATVQRTSRLRRPCYELLLSDGTKIVASDLHPWLVRNTRKNERGAFEWVQTQNLEVEDEFAKTVSPWEEDQSREAGWLAGFFDGEGSVSYRIANLTVSQRAGRVMRFAWEALKRRGYCFHAPYSKGGAFPGSRPVQATWMCGVWPVMHFLGVIRPIRLLEGVSRLYEGKNAGKRSRKESVVSKERVRLVRIRFVGMRDVVGIQTSTRTFVAEGFFTHNSQLETRVMAHLSGDSDMIAACETGDIYVTMASFLFHKPLSFWVKQDGSFVNKEAKYLRQVVKAIVLGVGFGKMSKSVAHDIGCSESDAENFMTMYFGRFRKFYAFMEQQKRECRDHGFVRTMTGRYRRIPEIRSSDFWKRAHAERMALNSPVQGSAADIVAKAMQVIADSGLCQQYGCHMLLQVHDELLFEGPPKQMPLFLVKVREICEHPFASDLRVKLVFETYMGTSWGSAKV